MSTCLRSFSNYCVHGIFSFKRCVEILCMIVYYRKMKDSFRRSGSCGFRATSELKKHRQVTYGRCVKRKLDLQERLSVSFFFCIEALGGWLVAALHAIELEERVIQAVPDLLEFLLFGHHLICKHSQRYRYRRYLVETSSIARREKEVLRRDESV